MTVALLQQAALTGLLIAVALYGAVFEPPANAAARWILRTGIGLAASWLLIVLIVAGTPRP